MIYSIVVILLALKLAVATANGDSHLLTDNFISESYDASLFNSTLVADQSGALAPVTYTISNNSFGWQIQHGNSGRMLLAGWHDNNWGNLYASLDHNFAIEANASNLPLRVQFDLNIHQAEHYFDWGSFAIGSAQNAFIMNTTNKFSSLFRANGDTQQFAFASDISNGCTWISSGSTITIILSNTAGTGSPFNGNGSVARLYVNGGLAGKYDLDQMAATDGYITFEALSAFAIYDNLSVDLSNSLTPMLGLSISNVRASQRAGTKLVDINFNLAGGSPPYSVTIQGSVDGGATWTLPTNSLTGDVGNGVGAGTNRQITWNAGADWNDQSITNARFRIVVTDP